MIAAVGTPTLSGVLAALETIGRTLAEVSIALAALGAVALAIDLALRPLRRPQLRILPWLLLLLRPALPLATLAALLGWEGAAVLPAFVPGFDVGPAAGPPVSLADPSTTGPIAGSAWTVPAILSLVWFLGVVLLTARTIRGHARVRRSWLARTVAFESDLPSAWQTALERARVRIGLRRAQRVSFVRDLPSPLVLGVVRPRILVPARLADADSLTAAAREHILLHECAHIRRRDPWLGAWATAVGIAFWFHPVVGAAHRHLRDLIELAADAHVARALHDGTAAYRSTLLRLAAERHGLAAPLETGALPSALGLLSRRASILTRLRALERPGVGSERTPAFAGATLFLLLATTLLPTLGSIDRAAASVPPADNPIPPALAATETATTAMIPPPATPEQLLATDPPGCLAQRYAVFAQLANETTDSRP